MAQRRITFAGSTVGEPWWTLGEIVSTILAEHDIGVDISDESFSHHNIAWVAGRRADLGATTPVHLAAALASTGAYQGQPRPDLVLLAVVRRPAWLALAVRHELGVGDLREIAARRMPVRILADSPDPGRELDVVLRHHGTSLQEITSWGGRFFRWLGRQGGAYVRESVVDLMLGNLYLGYTPHNRFWYDATTLYDMRFLDYEPDLVASLQQRFGYLAGSLPHGIFRGVERDIRCPFTDRIYVYSRPDLPDDVAAAVVGGFRERADLFRQTRSALYYDPEDTGQSEAPIPLHPAVERQRRRQEPGSRR